MFFEHSLNALTNCFKGHPTKVGNGVQIFVTVLRLLSIPSEM